MPIYEYECPECGRFEVMQRASEPAFEECPRDCCKSTRPRVQRLISAAAFHLKGSGWYKTDYAGAGAKPENAGEGGDSAPKKGSEGNSEGGASKKEETTPKKDPKETSSGSSRATGP